ncbi:hypothetical protein CN679_00510 [Bacillus pseudomycoides]|nr:hypothetical protein CN679_00510 [Bacillus pseudomycoides]
MHIFVKNKKERTKNKTLSMNIRQNSINLTKNQSVTFNFREKTYIYLKMHKDISVSYRMFKK